jgi:hypothetical protein
MLKSFVNKDLISTYLPPHKERLMNINVNPFEKFYKPVMPK